MPLSDLVALSLSCAVGIVTVFGLLPSTVISYHHGATGLDDKLTFPAAAVYVIDSVLFFVKPKRLYSHE